jgi:SAM-dependent methyltransferase
VTDIPKECQLCGSTGPHKTVAVREMMFGTRELFDYFDCAACGTLQILNALEDGELERHYPPGYYSYGASAQPTLLRWLTTQQDRFELQTRGRYVGALITALLPRRVVHTVIGDTVKIIHQLAVQHDAHILDVGCGGGALLDRLARAGFRNLLGADPFIDSDGKTPSGVPLMKRYLSEVDGTFDLIMFNHSLEHVPDPVAMLKAAYNKLAVGGSCLVRVPTTSSAAWTMYGADWIDVDAPRHIVIPSRRGMALAAERVGLRVERTFDDSTFVQFLGSEAYRRDLVLTDPRLFWKMLRAFGPKQVWDWGKRAEKLNQDGRGAWAGFVLRAK